MIPRTPGATLGPILVDRGDRRGTRPGPSRVGPAQPLGDRVTCSLLHLEIVQERLEREYDLDILATAPSVEYHVTPTNGPMVEVDNPSDFPASGDIEKIEEPWMDISIFTPTR